MKKTVVSTWAVAVLAVAGCSGSGQGGATTTVAARVSAAASSSAASAVSPSTAPSQGAEAPTSSAQPSRVARTPGATASGGQRKRSTRTTTKDSDIVHTPTCTGTKAWCDTYPDGVNADYCADGTLTQDMCPDGSTPRETPYPKTSKKKRSRAQPCPAERQIGSYCRTPEEQREHQQWIDDQVESARQSGQATATPTP